MSRGLPISERIVAMFCHVSSVAVVFFPLGGNIMAPLVIWLLRHTESPFIDFHGKESINFQLTLTIYLVSGVLLWMLSGGHIVVAVMVGCIVLYCIVMVIVATVMAYREVEYQYPLSLRFFK